MKNLLILGAGGYGRTVADVASHLGCYQQIFFLDDSREGADILGKCADYIRFSGADMDMYPAFGSNGFRMKWLNTLLENGIPVPVLVHPRAYVSPTAKLGVGTVVLPLAVVNTAAVVGNGCILNIGALMDHDSILEDGVHLAPGAIVKAENRIPAGTKIDSGEVVENHKYPL